MYKLLEFTSEFNKLSQLFLYINKQRGIKENFINGKAWTGRLK